MASAAAAVFRLHPCRRLCRLLSPIRHQPTLGPVSSPPCLPSTTEPPSTSSAPPQPSVQRSPFSPSPSFLAATLKYSRRHFSSPPSQSSFTNTTASFDWSDDEDEGGQKKQTAVAKEVDKSKLPPPYDPFSKKPLIEEPKDPKDLQEIFHRMRTEGLTDYAVKMFDALSKDGLTHEALELFSQIKDKGSMPDVVAHTAVLEAYANAGGHSKDVVRTYERMLASGVTPNAYTYSVLVRGLAKDGKIKEAGKYLVDMMGKGMNPNVATYTAVFEAYVKEEKDDEARELLVEMKGKGFAPNEKAVREQLGRRGQLFRRIMSLMFGK